MLLILCGFGVNYRCRKHDLPIISARPERLKHIGCHIGCRTPVMGLPSSQLQMNRAAISIGKRMDFGRQPAARTNHATGSLVFLTVARMLMDADRRGVDHLDITIMSF